MLVLGLRFGVANFLLMYLKNFVYHDFSVLFKKVTFVINTLKNISLII